MKVFYEFFYVERVLHLPTLYQNQSLELMQIDGFLITEEEIIDIPGSRTLKCRPSFFRDDFLER